MPDKNEVSAQFISVKFRTDRIKEDIECGKVKPCIYHVVQDLLLFLRENQGPFKGQLERGELFLLFCPDSETHPDLRKIIQNGIRADEKGYVEFVQASSPG